MFPNNQLNTLSKVLAKGELFNAKEKWKIWVGIGQRVNNLKVKLIPLVVCW